MIKGVRFLSVGTPFLADDDYWWDDLNSQLVWMSLDFTTLRLETETEAVEGVAKNQASANAIPRRKTDDPDELRKLLTRGTELVAAVGPAIKNRQLSPDLVL